MPGPQPSNRKHPHPNDVERTFPLVITKGADGWLIGVVPTLHGCHTQGRTPEEVRQRIREAILLCLVDPELPEGDLVSVESVTVEG